MKALILRSAEFIEGRQYQAGDQLGVANVDKDGNVSDHEVTDDNRYIRPGHLIARLRNGRLIVSDQPGNAKPSKPAKKKSTKKKSTKKKSSKKPPANESDTNDSDAAGDASTD